MSKAKPKPKAAPKRAKRNVPTQGKIAKSTTQNSIKRKRKGHAPAKEKQAAPEPIGADGLTGKERAWIYEYPRDWNGTAAARRAGYRGNSNTLGVTAHRLLRNAKILEVLRRRLAELTMEADEVLARLADQARSSFADFLTPRGNLSLAEARRAGKLHLVHAYSKGRAGTRIELYDTQAALVHLGKHLGLFIEKVAFTDPTGQKEYAESAREELARRLARVAAGEREVELPGKAEPGASGSPAL